MAAAGQVEQLVVDEDPAGRSSEFRVDAFLDDAWKTLVGPTVNATPSGGTLTTTFDPVVATRIRCHMLASAAAARPPPFLPPETSGLRLGGLDRSQKADGQTFFRQRVGLHPHGFPADSDDGEARG